MSDFRGFLIVTDLDGTFFGPHTARIERNIEAVKRFTEGGGIFTIATGRYSDVVRDALPDVGELVNAPVIGCNGAQLFDFESGETLAERPLGPEAGPALDFILERYPGCGIRISCPGGFLTSRENYESSPMLIRDLSRVSEERVRFLPRARWEELKWYKIVVRAPADKIECLRSDLERLFPGQFSLSKSGMTYFEIQSRGTDKSVHLDYLRTYTLVTTGLPVKLVAAGDYENDVPMLKRADISVCPANATDEAKKAAKYCFCANTEGLIGDVVDFLENGGYRL